MASARAKSLRQKLVLRSFAVLIAAGFQHMDLGGRPASKRRVAATEAAEAGRRTCGHVRDVPEEG